MSRNDPTIYHEGREANEGLQYRKKESRQNYGQDEFIDDATIFKSEEESPARRDNYRIRYKEEDKWNERDMNLRSQSQRNRNEEENRHIYGEKERYVNPYQVYKSEDDFPYQTQYENFDRERDAGRLRKMREDEVRSQYLDNRERRTNFSGMGPKGYKKSDDRIEEEVCNALMRDRNVNAGQIEVSVSNGVVTLNGMVDNRSARFDAEMAVDTIRGVADIQNNLKVRKRDEREEYYR